MKQIFVVLFWLVVQVGMAQVTYFQQEVDYTIEVSLDDVNHMLNGNIEMVYTNNSPDALSFIWMHLWPNAYSSPNSALAKQQFRSGNLFMFYALQRDLGGIDSLDFKVNGIHANWSFHPDHLDIAKVELDQPLQVGEKVTISTPFRVKLPSGSISRLGHIGDSYQITQWYPKPAVYDKDGWHEMPYLNQGEFYSEYGSFDVKITLPKNYVVGATGDLQNNPEELDWLEAKAAATRAIVNFPDGNEFPASSPQLKTLHFKQENVHDFAWFADKRWYVLKGEVELPHSKRKVTTWAMFTAEDAELWKKSIEYLNDATYYYSLWNGDYPYDQVTAVDGTISAGGGMEYPNVTVIGGVNSAFSLENVIMHEVGHNWFYGILGSNERDHAWMDEGINSFNETRYMITKYDSLSMGVGMLPGNVLRKLGLTNIPYRMQDELAYMMSARLQSDQPMECHADEFTDTNYGTIVYKKTAAAFAYLQAYLGEDRFDHAMKAYFEEWKFKHPQPEDLRQVLERETGEDLTWFFDDLVKTKEKVDFKIKGVKHRGDRLEVKVKNKGGVPGPIELVLTNEGRVVESKWFNAGLERGETTVLSIASHDADRVMIDGNERMLEYNRHNNLSRTKGIFRRVEPFQLKFLTAIENPERTQLFWTPVAGWNEQNKWMVGLNLHNTMLLPRDVELSFTPMYSFASKKLTGFGRLSYYKNNLQVHLKTQSFRRFLDPSFLTTDYVRNALEVNYRFDKVRNAPWSSALRAELVHYKEFREYSQLVMGDLTRPEDIDMNFDLLILPALAYEINRAGVRIDHAFELSLRAAFNEDESYDHAMLTSFTYEGAFRHKLRKNRKEKELRWRFYAGKKSEGAVYGGLPLTTGGLNGATDLYADALYLTRNHDASSTNSRFIERQITDGQGGTFMQNLAKSYVASARIEYELPVRFPLTLFASVVVFDRPLSAPHDDWNYNGGVSFELVKDIAEIHVPLISRWMYSSAEGNQPEDFITFELNLNKLSPQRALRSVRL